MKTIDKELMEELRDDKLNASLGGIKE